MLPSGQADVKRQEMDLMSSQGGMLFSVSWIVMCWDRNLPFRIIEAVMQIRARPFKGIDTLTPFPIDFST